MLELVNYTLYLNKMKILKIFLWIIISLVVIVVLAAGYFGLVPGVSTLFGSNKARDLGVTTSAQVFTTASDKIAMVRSGSAKTGENVSYSGSHPVAVSLSSEEISSLISNGEWKYNPISEDFQMKVNTDGTVEVAGLLNRTRLDGYLKATGFSNVLTYTSKFNFLPEKVPFYLDGALTITDNNVDLKLTSAEVGRTPLPTDSGAVGAVKSFIQKRISGVAGMNVTSLDFSNGKLNFNGSLPSKMNF